MVTYTIVIENSGSGVATNVVMTDPLLAGVSFGSQSKGSALIALPGIIYQWGPYDVAARTAYTVAFTANVTDSRAFAGSTITNSAYIAASNAVPVDDSDSFTIAGGFYIYLPVVLRSY